MGQQIIKQPDGKYAIFSSVVDDFVALNCEPQDIIDMWLEEEKQRIERMVAEEVRKLNDPKARLRHTQVSWEEALRIRKDVHGDDEDFKTDPFEMEGEPI